MNDFLQQFLTELRELAEQAAAALLSLEEGESTQALDEAFRAFHTLKGAAGIMEFDAMVRLMHAAEDILSGLRDDPVGAGSVAIADCLAALDQMQQWLDVIEATGEPPPDASRTAGVLAERFARGAIPLEDREPAPPFEDWRGGLLARHPGAARDARFALLYEPGPEAFFHDVDPLRFFRDMSGLLALEIDTTDHVPSLSEVNPFSCFLVFRALLSEASSAAIARLRHIGADVRVEELRQQADARPLGLTTRSAEILEAQISMLEAAESGGLSGRVGSALRVAVGALRHEGLAEDADRLAELAARTPSDDKRSLMDALERILTGTPAPEAAGGEQTPRSTPEIVARVLRVDADRVESLVNLAGEFLVAKNELGHTLRLAEAETDIGELARLLRKQHTQLERLTTDLRHSVLKMRVLPMRHVFQRFPRIVRDLTAALGKPTRLVIQGDSTEADKAIVEGLFEPLLHVLRNAMDHGVETVAERSAAGKSPSATISLSARREADRVIVEIADDGRGIDLDAIRTIAIKRGLADADAALNLSDEDALELIFAPGFSTASHVTDLSGRGVGMDAVRAAIERLGGSVAITSAAGRGVTIGMSLPFSVAMIQVLTVEAGGQTFGIPLDSVVETVRLSTDDIFPVGSARAFVLRNRTVPLIDLADILGEAGGADGRRDISIVVVTAGGNVGGLQVDSLGSSLYVMLKPLDGLLSSISGIIGATVLGDGRVLLVLNLQELLA